MKNSKLYTLMAAAAILLSSCGSLSITQKRYSNGLNFDWFAAKEDKGGRNKSETSKPEKTRKTIVFKPLETSSPQSVTEVTTPANAPVAAPTVAAAPALEQSHVAAVKTSPGKLNKSSASFSTLKENAKALIKKNPLSKASRSAADQSDDSDVSMIILVLLALFIPPLAVFLYFGEIETHFWINLILWVVIGGGIYSAGGGILGIGLATIHALLVIFGVFG